VLPSVVMLTNCGGGSATDLGLLSSLLKTLAIQAISGAKQNHERKKLHLRSCSVAVVGRSNGCKRYAKPRHALCGAPPRAIMAPSTLHPLSAANTQRSRVQLPPPEFKHVQVFFPKAQSPQTLHYLYQCDSIDRACR